MDQPVTYQQLLAEQYADSATQILAFQQTDYDEEETNIDPYHPQQWTAKEHPLENQNAFRGFPGNRNSEQDFNPQKTFDDKSKLSVRYNKDVRTNVFNIDSRFRSYYLSLGIPNILPPNPTAGTDPAAKSASVASSSSGHFLFRPSKAVKNAISLKISSIELPNKFWNIFKSRGNNRFRVRENISGVYGDWVEITMEDGYYTNLSVITTLSRLLRDTAPTIVNAEAFNVTIGFYFNTGNIEITTFDNPDVFYEFDFKAITWVPGRTYNVNDFVSYSDGTTSNTYKCIKRVVSTTPPPADDNASWIVSPFLSLGSMLGFYKQDVSTQNAQPYSFVASATQLPNFNVDPYIYLRVNDYSTIIPQTIGDTYFTVFAKIPITVEKGSIVNDTLTSNTTTKIYHLLQPTNINQLELELLDAFGEPIIFNPDTNWSMTFEVEEVVSQALYEKMREL